jgi:hypothetical protein
MTIPDKYYEYVSENSSDLHWGTIFLPPERNKNHTFVKGGNICTLYRSLNTQLKAWRDKGFIVRGGKGKYKVGFLLD